jgi:hypothetical protein
LGLGSLQAAEFGEGGYDRPRPLVHFIFAQRALVGLEFCPQQDRIFTSWNLTAAEDLDRGKAAQFRQAKSDDGPFDAREADFIGEEKGEVALNRGKFR